MHIYKQGTHNHMNIHTYAYTCIAAYIRKHNQFINFVCTLQNFNKFLFTTQGLFIVLLVNHDTCTKLAH